MVCCPPPPTGPDERRRASPRRRAEALGQPQAHGCGSTSARANLCGPPGLEPAHQGWRVFAPGAFTPAGPLTSRLQTPQQEQATVPWHQDIGYLDESCWTSLQVRFLWTLLRQFFPMTRRWNCSQLTAWIPMVDANRENGCMQVEPQRQGNRAATRQALLHRVHFASSTRWCAVAIEPDAVWSAPRNAPLTWRGGGRIS